MANVSRVDICNQAISKVGGEPLDALDEDTPLGAYCLINYPQAVAWALGIYRWSFATRIAQLAEIANPTISPLPHVFALPSDIVGQVHAYRKTASIDGQKIRHFMTADGVATESAATFAEYTAALPEAAWPSWFSEFFVTAFAAGIARNKQNQSLAGDLRDMAVGSRFKEVGEPGGLLLQAMERDSDNAPQRQLGGFDVGPLVMAHLTSLYGLPGPAFYPGPFIVEGAPTYIDFTGV